jgi:preprotein translocase subunit SecE
MSAQLNNKATNNKQNISESIQSTLAELRRPRMHWPARAEAARAVVAVLTLLAIGAGLVGFVDLLLSRVLDPFLNVLR